MNNGTEVNAIVLLATGMNQRHFSPTPTPTVK